MIRPYLSPLEESWLAEQWLNSSGVFPDTTIDTLLTFAYVHKGVLHNGVTIEIDQDEDNNGENPSVTYKIKLDTSTGLKWSAIKRAQKIKGDILRKSAILALIKVGAPYKLDEEIKSLAKHYLPKKYKVEVQIVE